MAHDVEAEIRAQLSEEEAWKIERELGGEARLRHLLIKVEQTSGNPADAWTIDYNRVMDLLTRQRSGNI